MNTPMDRLLRWFYRGGVTKSLGGTPSSQEAQCQYTDLDTGVQCELIVAPYAGWRNDYSVFCSDEHAAWDQRDAPM